MKKIEWVNGNKMRIDTGHRTFDRQTNIISTGNIYANTETGSFIRPSSELECNGFPFPAGHLQEYDLKGFEHLPHWIERQVRELTDQHNGAILYKFFHYYHPREYSRWSRQRYTTGRETQFVHGYILTTRDHKLIRIFHVDQSNKTYDILAECAKYVSEAIS